MAFSQVTMAILFLNNGIPAPIAILIGLIVGGLLGLANGLMVTKLKLLPFIATLGMFNVAFALTRICTAATVLGKPSTGFAAASLRWLLDQADA